MSAPTAPVGNRSQVVGYMPRGKESFVLRRVEVMTLSADMPGFFVGNGLQLDFESDRLTEGSFSLWLTLPDAKALQAQIEAAIEKVEAWR